MALNDFSITQQRHIYILHVEHRDAKGFKTVPAFPRSLADARLIAAKQNITKIESWTGSEWVEIKNLPIL